MGLLLPLAYALALTQGAAALAAWRQRDPWPGLLWVLAVASSGIMGAALVMSWSRGALLGLATGAGLVTCALGRRYWLLAAVAALLVVVVGVGPLAQTPGDLLGRVTDLAQYSTLSDLATVEINDDNFAVIERMAHWLAALRLWERSPWLGVGAGQYAVLYPQVALPRWQDPLGHAHNYYLHVLAEGGLVGLAGYLLFVTSATVAMFRRAWLRGDSPQRHRGTEGRGEEGKRGKGEKDGIRLGSAPFALLPLSPFSPSPWARGVALGALGMMGHLLAHSFFDNLYVHEMYLVVAMLLGLAVVCAGPSISSLNESSPHC
jgi:O-antigen ligase